MSLRQLNISSPLFHKGRTTIKEKPPRILNRSKWHVFKTYLPQLIGSTILVFILFIFLYFFLMIHVVQPVDTYGNPLAIKGTEELKGKNLLLISEREVRELLTQANPTLKKLQIVKIYPQTIRLVAQVNIPVAYYAISESTYVLLSQDATPLAYVYEKPKDMGEITYYQKLTNGEYQLGRPIQLTDIIFAATVAGLIQESGYTDYSVAVEDTELIRILVGKVEIKAANKGNIKAQIASIQQVLRLIKTNGEQIRSVDVRFDRMILEKW